MSTPQNPNQPGQNPNQPGQNPGQPGQAPNQAPGYGYPQAPGYGYPPPAPQPPKKHTGRNIGLGCAGAVVAFIVIGIIAVAAGGGSSHDSKSAAGAPSSPTAAASRPSSADKELENTQKHNEDGRDKLQKDIDKAASKAPAPKSQPKGQSFGDGDYQVGKDMPAGTYETNGADSSLFPLCTITTAPASDAKFPQLKTANKNERIIISLSEGDGVVTIQGCTPLELRK